MVGARMMWHLFNATTSSKRAPGSGRVITLQ
jgi:hypothetical protein